MEEIGWLGADAIGYSESVVGWDAGVGVADIVTK